VPGWLRETIDDSSTVGIVAFVAVPLLAILLRLVGLVPRVAPMFVLAGWTGVLAAIWLRRTGRLS
jgi:hypothetical protein